MSDQTKKRFAKLDPRTLRRPDRYQRLKTSMRDVRAMSADFRDGLMTVIVVSQRSDGSYWVVDGWHRTLAAIAADEKYIDCQVFTGLSEAEEADLFWRLDTKRRGLTGDDVFRSRLEAGDPTAAEIWNTLEEIGYSLGFGQRLPGGFRAWKTALALHSRFGMPTLAKALRILHHAWPDSESAASAAILDGMCFFVSRYKELSEREIARTLGVTTPERLLQAGREMTRSLAWATRLAMARAILGAYNHRRSTNRLEDRLA